VMLPRDPCARQTVETESDANSRTAVHPN